MEEALKEEKIDQETYDKLRYQIAGGDLSSTHLVKGLDFELLKRIRNGEDVYGNKKEEAEVEEEQEEEPEPDVDDEFDQLEKQDVQAVEKDKAEKKKGQFSSVSLAPGKKRTRDQILAEMKAMREAAKARPESSLGGRFKNGNIHVIFHKHALHLVDRLNARIAGPLPKALPAPGSL